MMLSSGLRKFYLAFFLKRTYNNHMVKVKKILKIIGIISIILIWVGWSARTDYNWSMPSRIFDMKHDECILIGKEYWDHIGGKGTYIALLKLFEIVGEKTRKQLKDLTSQL